MGLLPGQLHLHSGQGPVPSRKQVLPWARAGHWAGPGGFGAPMGYWRRAGGGRVDTSGGRAWEVCFSYKITARNSAGRGLGRVPGLVPQGLLPITALSQPLGPCWWWTDVVPSSAPESSTGPLDLVFHPALATPKGPGLASGCRRLEPWVSPAQVSVSPWWLHKPGRLLHPLSSVSNGTS